MSADTPGTLVRAALRTSAAAKAGMSEGEYCMARLRTFEQRHGRALSAAQRFQLEALERQHAPATQQPIDGPFSG